MRFNNKKLAALAMSAVMAASTMPMTAFAAEDVVATDAAAEQVLAAVVTVDDVTFDANGTATVSYSDGSTEKLQAGKKLITEATCDAPAVYKWNITVKGEEWSDDKTFSEGKALGHDYQKIDTVVTEATCKTLGEGKTEYICSRCGAQDPKKPAETYSIPMIDHKANADGTKTRNTLDKDGKNIDVATGELVDKTQDGLYYVETYFVCEYCKEEQRVGDLKKVEVSATDVQVASKTITELKNIGDAEVSDGMDAAKVKADAKIKLQDCGKEGSYVIVSWDKNGKELSRETHTIAPHHVTVTTAVAKKDTEESLLDKKFDEKTGELVSVTSKSCVKDVEYYEIVTCVAENAELSKTLKTAKAAGNHIKNNDGKDAVDAAVKEAKDKGYVSKATYTALKANAESYGIKLDVTDACEAAGTLTITYLCKVCGKEDGTATVKVEKLGHDYDNAVAENVVEATCAKEGTYDSVQYCKVCKDRKVVRTGIKTEKLAHSFVKEDKTTDETGAYVKFDGTVVVDKAGYHLDKKGKAFDINECYSADFGVTAKALVKCDKCGETEDLKKAVEVVVSAITKQSANGDAGSITLKATFTKNLKDNKTEKVTEEYTVPYFSSMVAYLDRNPEKDPVNGLHQDKDGIFRYYVNDEFQKDFAGIVTFNGGEFFVANGVLCSKAYGLNEFGGKWYFLSQGQIQRGFTGLASYNGKFFYLINGELDTSINGLVPYNGGTFLFSNGRLRNDVSGLWQNTDGSWYYLALGQVQNQHTGVAQYDGAFFYVRNGKLATDFNGTVQYDGASFKVVSGQLVV